MDYGEIIRKNDNLVDKLETAMIENFPIVDPPKLDLFTPGLYVRQLFMSTADLITSRIHKFIHPFTISKGIVAVSIDGSDWVQMEAGHTGITYSGTRRILYIIEDCLWTTYHVLPYITGEENQWSEEDKAVLVERIENEILEPHINIITGSDIHNEYKELLNKRRLQ